VPNILCVAELGSVFFSVREKNFDERGNRRKTDREFSRKAELETEMARNREECVYPMRLCWASTDLACHSAKRRAEEEEVAKKTAAGTSTRIIVPGTPRHAGIGAGARVSQTPRRRGGI
jgi:pre-mRNA-splicing factor ATP-dependent RNA helicase DHX38/PRP16